ncbi:MerR family transcriptional regulator [Gordonia sp. MP11Mi]|uniref:HTH merR-type domain-containing protein n=1 Tax=Gordonia sp. MP11Mi TaxID=3022769 RepID=A0AA97CWI3_9ACTN
MRIGEFAARAGVTPRIVRHYEDQSLLCPARTSTGYREFTLADLDTVARIRLMIDAGLNTAAIRAYLDCVATGSDGPVVQMCPNLRRAVDAVGERLDRKVRQVEETRSGLDRLTDAAR